MKVNYDNKNVIIICKIFTFLRNTSGPITAPSEHKASA